MRDLVTMGDIQYLKTQYPDKSIRMPSVIEQRVLLLYMRGMSRAAITVALGDTMGMDANKAKKLTTFLGSPTGKALIDLFREREFKDVRVSRENLTQLLFESYHKAGTVLEEIAAIREIGKMNGLYKSDEKQAKGANVTINQTGNIQNVRQLERMSETQLNELANDMGVVLDPNEAARKDLPKLPPTQEDKMPESPSEVY